MAKDAPVNTGAPDESAPAGSFARVSRMQTKLHRWASAEVRSLFSTTCSTSCTTRPRGPRRGPGSRATPGRVRRDGRSAADVEATGVQDVLDGLRDAIRSGGFRPMPVRERLIPKPGGEGGPRRPPEVPRRTRSDISEDAPRSSRTCVLVGLGLRCAASSDDAAAPAPIEAAKALIIAPTGCCRPGPSFWTGACRRGWCRLGSGYAAKKSRTSGRTFSICSHCGTWPEPSMISTREFAIRSANSCA